jgi:CSLREA domain-containing protein
MKSVFTRVLMAVAFGGTLLAQATPALALGVVIVVDSTSDAEFVDNNTCTLRGAIVAANTGAVDGGCVGSTSADRIQFSIGSGTPTINVGGALPTISQSLTVRGNTGGATRVRLHGSGVGNGLTFQNADGSSVRSMVIDGFVDGIRLNDTDATIASNVIGPNTAYGINASTGSNTLTIGGSNSLTPEPCSGDCNRISGNGLTGISGFVSGIISGNFIGVNAAGTGAQGNKVGISARPQNFSPSLTIGGATAAARNVISGNIDYGVAIGSCNCTIQGNYVGTDPSGTVAVANGTGMSLVGSGCGSGGGGGGGGCSGSGTWVGGTNSGEGNVVSGNVHAGMVVTDFGPNDSLQVYGNGIGTKAAGGALGNGGDGILLSGVVEYPQIGSINVPGSFNVIAYNGGAGIRLSGSGVTGAVLRKNFIHDNAGRGIRLENGANGSVIPPSVASVTPMFGAACPGCTVDIYSDNGDEGATWHGSATADQNGYWQFSGTVYGPQVTVTATAQSGTSEFSSPRPIAPFKPDGRIRLASNNAFLGDNNYNTTGAYQTVTASAPAGGSLSYVISIQNDSSRYDAFKVRAMGAAVTGYTVRYFVGGTERTAAIQAGTFSTGALAPGQAFAVAALVNVANTAAVGSNVNRLIVVTSQDPSKQDAVRFLAKRN